MFDRTDLIYRYDGSFDGLLTCVFESFAHKERPGQIQGPDCNQFSLFSTRVIRTDSAKANRVRAGISQKISAEALGLVLNASRTCLPDRETLILDFLRLGFRMGPRVLEHCGDPCVIRLYQGEAALQQEAHHYKGFVRFTDAQGALSSVIEPKNDVLPLLMPHFLNRFPRESFLIFDRTHRRALVGAEGRGRIIPLEALELPEAGADEQLFRALWRRYYSIIAIEGRENPRGMQSHLPRRFWGCMTEFQSPDQSRADLPDQNALRTS